MLAIGSLEELFDLFLWLIACVSNVLVDCELFSGQRTSVINRVIIECLYEECMNMTTDDLFRTFCQWSYEDLYAGNLMVKHELPLK